VRLARVLSPAPRDLWNDLVAANPRALPSQTPTWLNAICRIHAYEDASRCYEMTDGRHLVLPMVRRRRLPGRLATEHSMAPTWGAGGLLARDALGVDDVRVVVDDLAARPALRTTIRPDFLQADMWAAARPRGAIELPLVHHVLDLDRSYDELSSKFSKMARKAIRRAEREAVKIDHASGRTFVDDYYELYEGWVTRRAQQRGIPLPIALRRGRANEPLERLRLLADELGDTFQIWVAQLDGRPVAAMITLMQGDTALAWRAASNIEVAGPVRANDLLHSRAIEHATATGCRYYNMGESGGVESLMRFKVRFGATPRSHAAYRLERLPITPVTAQVERVRSRAEQVVLDVASRRRGDAPSAAPTDD
jgi:hypothetical protein